MQHAEQNLYVAMYAEEQRQGSYSGVSLSMCFGIMHTTACGMQNRTSMLVCTLKSSAKKVIQVSP